MHPTIGRLVAIATLGAVVAACAPLDDAGLLDVARVSQQAYAFASENLRDAYVAAQDACLAALQPKRPPAVQDTFGDPALASLIAEASNRFGVSERWIRAVMEVESYGDGAAVSPKGALGLMQVMPDTYAELSNRHGLGSDPRAPRDNVLAGGALIRQLYDRYGSPGFIAAYNAGPRRYDDYLVYGRALPDETLRYVAAVRVALGEEGRALGSLPSPGRQAGPPLRQPISISPDGILILKRTGQPVPVADRLALHGMLARAVQRAAR